MNKQYRKMIDEPTMSDKTLLVSVEDLIHTAFGSLKETKSCIPSSSSIGLNEETLMEIEKNLSINANRVNFKMLQTVFHILARQLRLLEQEVEIKFDEFNFALEQRAGYDDGYDDESDTYSSSSEEREKGEGRAERGRKRDEKRERIDRSGKEDKGDKRDRGKKGDKMERGEKGTKDEKGEKGERTGRQGKGGKKDGKITSKDQEGKGRSKDRDEKDKRDREQRSRGRRGEDDGDAADRERGRGWERGGDKDRRSRGKRGEDDGDEGGRERRRGREQGGERGADERERWGRERGADGRRVRRGEREYRDAQEQAHEGFGRDFGRQTSGTSITVSEATRGGPGGRGSADKILVAERGPAARVRSTRIGSIEVVTASEFALLGKKVEQLEQITRPPPAPVLPDNETLRQDLATGRASLQDTMQAVQLNARVQAAEQGLYRMAELLTQLAQSGMLPPEFAGQVGAMEEYLQAAMAAGYAAAGPGGPDGPVGRGVGRIRRVKQGADPRGAHFDEGIELGASGIGGTASTMSRTDAKKSTATVTADAESQSTVGVTHNEMHEVLQHMKDALFKEICNLTARAKHSAEMASSTSSNVAEKLDIAMRVGDRINSLFQQTADYEEQLSGFDSGIMTQVQSFQEQLSMMKNDLAGGLALLEASNNNAETAALLDLAERHQNLVVELDNTFHLHQNLHITQHQISEELTSLIQCVKMLFEQKADRDEVIDGLKSKADLSRLDGLLFEEHFAQSRFELEKRYAKCYEKFSRQNMKWQDSLKELAVTADNKAEIIMLMSLKDATNAELNDILKLLHKLEKMLGDPKAALLMRQLAKEAACGACLTRALMEPQEATYGKPLPLPALRPPPIDAERQPCGEQKPAPPDIREHICHRWVGGSHTLMDIGKEKAELMQPQIIPTKKFEGYGSDGRVYMMAEDMQPCAECIKLSTDEPGYVAPYLPTPTGAGDQASAPNVLRHEATTEILFNFD